MLILHRINNNYSKPTTPEWGDAVVRSRTTVLRIGFFCKTPDDYDLGSIRGFRLISARGFHNLFVTIRRENEFNKLLLTSSRVRITLIVYFQLIMKICYRNWYQCLSRPSKAVDSWENISEYAQFLVGFGSAQAGPQRTIPFFCWDRVAFFGRTGGREYSNSRNADKKEVSTNRIKRFVFYQLALFFWSYSITFWSYFITGLHVYCASSASGLLRPFSVKCEPSYPERSARTMEPGF